MFEGPDPGFIGHAHLGSVEGQPLPVVQSTLASYGAAPLAQQLYAAKRFPSCGAPG